MISKEDLLEFGFVENKEPSKVIYPFEKVILEQEIEGQDDTEPVLSLVLERFNESVSIGLISNDGHTIYLNGIESIEDLKVIEKCISSYRPNY